MQTLSFGTVIDVLIQCKKDVCNKTDLTTAVMNIVIPQNSCQNLNGSSLTSKLNSLYTCDSDLKTFFNDGKPSSLLKPNEAIVKQFEEKVVPLIKEDKYELVVLALCGMIEQDCTLNSENKTFKSYIGKDIQEFLNGKEYVLSEFLAGICLYTINEVKNRDCQHWIKHLIQNYKTSCKCLQKRIGYEDGFKNYVASFENNKRKILIRSTSSEKEQSQNTASQTTDNNVTPTLPREDTLGGETYEQYRIRTNTLVVPDIGLENQICLCCENWTGDMENTFNAPHGSLGKCTLKNEEMLSTNPMCKWDIPSLSRANKRRWASMFDSQ